MTKNWTDAMLNRGNASEQRGIRSFGDDVRPIRLIVAFHIGQHELPVPWHVLTHDGLRRSLL